MRQGEDACGGY